MKRALSTLPAAAIAAGLGMACASGVGNPSPERTVPPASDPGSVATAARPVVAAPGVAASAAPAATYYVYVGAESADLIHRVAWGPDGARVERRFPWV